MVDINAEDEASRRGVTYAEVATLIDEGFPYSGPIDYVSNTVDSATGTIQVRAVLPNERMSLFPALRQGSVPHGASRGCRLDS